MFNSKFQVLTNLVQSVELTQFIEKPTIPALQLYDLKEAYSALVDQSRQALIVSSYLLSGSITDASLTILNNGSDSMTNTEYKDYIDAQPIGTDNSDNLITVAQAIANPDGYYKQIEKFVSEAENQYIERASKFHLLDVIILDGLNVNEQKDLLSISRDMGFIENSMTDIKSKIYLELSEFLGYSDETKLKCDTEFGNMVSLGKVLDKDKTYFESIDGFKSKRASLVMHRIFDFMNNDKVRIDTSALTSNSSYLSTLESASINFFNNVERTEEDIKSPISDATPLDLWLESGFNVIGDIFRDGFSAFEAVTGTITSAFKTVVDTVADTITGIRADLEVANQLGLVYDDDTIPWYSYDGSFLSVPAFFNPISSFEFTYDSSTDTVGYTDTFTSDEDDVLLFLSRVWDPDAYEFVYTNIVPSVAEDFIKLAIRAGKLTNTGDAIMFVASSYIVRIGVQSKESATEITLIVTTHPIINKVGVETTYGNFDQVDMIDGSYGDLKYTNPAVLENTARFNLEATPVVEKVVVADGVYDDYDADGLYNGLNLTIGATHYLVKSIASIFGDACNYKYYPLTYDESQEVEVDDTIGSYIYYPNYVQPLDVRDTETQTLFDAVDFVIAGTNVSTDLVVSAYTPAIIAKKVENYILNGYHESGVTRQFEDPFVEQASDFSYDLSNNFVFLGSSWAYPLIDRVSTGIGFRDASLTTQDILDDTNDLCEIESNGVSKETTLTKATRTFSNIKVFRPTTISISKIETDTSTGSGTTTSVKATVPLTDILITFTALYGIREYVDKGFYYPDMPFSYAPATDEEKVNAFQSTVIKPYIDTLLKAAAVAGLIIFGPRLLKKIGQFTPLMLSSAIARRRRNKLMDAIGDTEGTSGSILSLIQGTTNPKLTTIESEVTGLKGSVSN